MTTQTHLLNSKSTHLEVAYREFDTKTRFDAISVKTDELVEHKFHLTDIWINNQPAKYVKGFKAKIGLDTSPVRAEMKDGKLYLFSDSFLSIPVTVKFKDQTRSFQVSPNLKVTGFCVLLENEFECSNYTIYNSDTATPLGNSYTLNTCGITENGSLEILINEDPYASIDQEITNPDGTENGLGMAPLRLNNLSETEDIPFDSNAHPSRGVQVGLNLEGTCTNEECEAPKTHKVCDPKGIGTFSLNEECVKAVCPSCYEPIDVDNIIFWDCIYTIEGMKEESTEIFLMKKRIAPKGNGTSFTEATGELSNVINWKYLKVKTTAYSVVSPYRCILF